MMNNYTDLIACVKSVEIKCKKIKKRSLGELTGKIAAQIHSRVSDIVFVHLEQNEVTSE